MQLVKYKAEQIKKAQTAWQQIKTNEEEYRKLIENKKNNQQEYFDSNLNQIPDPEGHVKKYK